MNTIWSTFIQSTGTLYDSRALRFADMFKSKYTDAFGIAAKRKYQRSAAVRERLRSPWQDGIHPLVQSELTEILILQILQKSLAPQIEFAEGDATQLPYESNSFDVTISNTVAEHIEPSAFYGEQYRVLREGGVCIVMSARKGVNLSAQCITEESELEKEIWNRLDKYFRDINEKYAICAYPQTEMELPLCMEKFGFKNVTTDYITINLTPDNPIYPKEMAYAMINADRRCAIDNAASLAQIDAGVVSDREIKELIGIINAKYDKRIELYDNGIKQWDTNMSVTMIMRGVK